MARITVEDCFKKLGNKFELSILASYRAKEISRGAPIDIERDNDKNAVISLREIASEHINVSKLRQAYTQSLQLYVPSSDVASEDDHDDDAREASSSSDELIESEFISFDEEDNSSTEDLEIDSVEDSISKDSKEE